MTDLTLSTMIREVLSEELAKLKLQGVGVGANAAAAAGIQHETVRVTNDADLNAFARRVLALMDDRATRRDFEAGRLAFGLERTGASPQTSGPPVAASVGPVHTIERGFISERQIDRLPNEVRRLEVGKAARITPLARDRARKRGIVIERIEP